MKMNESRFFLTVILGAAMLAALCAGVVGRFSTGAQASTGGTIEGTIHFEGTPPKRAKLDMGADPYCAGAHSEPVLAQDGAVNSNGTLPNAFVYIKDVPGTFQPPSQPVVLDQKGCMYVPHVLGLMANQPLRIVSSDPTTHNIHPLCKINREWNQSQPPGAPPLVHKFALPEIMIPVRCNQHPWMSAYIGVTSNPFYAVTGTEGTFTIKDVPPGEYTLTSWTATFGTQEQKVTVRAGETAHANFTFK
jgi:Carboxypeptidase regulatory-like domain